MVLLVLIAAFPLTFPWWRLQAVEVTGCPSLPSEVATSLEGLVGRSPLSVDPQWVRRQVEVWPGVVSVDVRLELPGTLKVHATAATPRGSVANGAGWRAVAEDGRLAGPLDGPIAPVLEGFTRRPDELSRGLAVAARLREATGAEVRAVRRITPNDLEVRLAGAGGEVVVWVRPTATASERRFCDLVAEGRFLAAWVDLRWQDRLVLGGSP
jgi:cell division septal protein FtsQ